MISLRDALFFAGGVAVGLYVAKIYARNQVDNAISTGLDKLGLGALAPVVQGLVTPAVVN